MAEPSSLQRLVAIGGGLLLIRKGVATRGLLGLADILVGAAALYRGIAPARPRASVHQLHPLPVVERVPPGRQLVSPASLVKTPFQQ
ncbi:hypothetical protein TUM18999_27080 [Pseudomonas tohonis]|uniref:DUF2892 domain-containing protein n=1 Tax=Pseudomonas tohonis TaxID=2725477 RepID=A0A6J4E3Y8_9PSED|nr:hypothetical protein [Pseudomonas tohonis]BCG24517.1 hypothetical protein TUM18999_27080 [Pseudomonas tohonis]GJN52125.1 hypothetical protein TUM20286_18770 [Pseudomonas tohonis]